MFHLRTTTLFAAIMVAMAMPMPAETQVLSRTPELGDIKNTTCTGPACNTGIQTLSRQPELGESKKVDCSGPPESRPIDCELDEHAHSHDHAEHHAKSAVELPVLKPDAELPDAELPHPKLEVPSDKPSSANPDGIDAEVQNALSVIKPKGKKGSRKCVDALLSDFADGTNVQLWGCNDSDAQIWSLKPNGHISLQDTEYCLDASTAHPKNGTKMKIWTCHDNHAPQLWTHEQNGALRLQNTNLCLDLTDGIMSNGNILQVWECSKTGVNQQWSVEAL